MPKAKKINYTESDLIELFNLSRIIQTQTNEMQRWLTVESPIFSSGEQDTFDRILPLAVRDIAGWNEEDLKMLFISQILQIGRAHV